MPLVIVVLIIVCACMGLSNSNAKATKEQQWRSESTRRTNAQLECKLAQQYYKNGCSKEEAVRRSYEDMAKAGFDPCIPIGAYNTVSWNAKELDCRPLQFDSFLIERRRDAAKWEWGRAHAGEPIPPDWLHEQIYGTPMPTSEIAYKAELDRLQFKWDVVPVGCYFSYPGLGTCEVIEIKRIGNASGLHKVRVLQTGEIRMIPVNDKKIKMLG